MPRANRVTCPGYVWHLTHRCHKRSFLLKFARDRRRWRHWLFEARRRYGLSVLNYIVTSNHVHLLCADRGEGEISKAMQLVAGRTAQEFNQRKNRQGAFWEDRYHATAVQTDGHLARCMTYIDLNMVRAGVAAHPRDWDVTGYNEIQNPWRRKGVIDFAALRTYLSCKSDNDLANLQEHLLDSQLHQSTREPIWTEAVAVGDERFLIRFQADLGARGRHRLLSQWGQQSVLREDAPDYLADFGHEMAGLSSPSQQL